MLKARARKKAKAFGVDIKFICSDIFDVNLKGAKLYSQIILYSS